MNNKRFFLIKPKETEANKGPGQLKSINGSKIEKSMTNNAKVQVYKTKH